MDQFKAILLRQCRGFERGTIVDAMAGGDGFEGRWRVLRPVDLVGAWLVPQLDADRAVSTKEAVHILSFRRGPGWNVSKSSVQRYISTGILAPAGFARRELGASKRGSQYISREATWKMPFPKRRQPFRKATKNDPQEDDE